MQEIKKDLYLIDKAELLQVIMEKKNALWRLCQICCSFPKAENHYEVTYSFANGYDFANYRLIVEKDEEVPSISRVYKSAIYYENEMHELWGLNVDNIKVDLHDKLYRIDVETPFMEKEDK
ncbi:MAG: NADH-quinone oxidoreductase subunit C [Pseudobutyrivibrio ruminis]|uniref:NADH-quinone oxidoreductase subunit C n=1 Tax=Pseudobutyrivibrio ruminis TaxID=46206 RepID=A0A927U6Y5_9FIRM|nr:NADH-quinone oxidoreductase subunit C [Pseudobutyrivibrio ruminis]